MNGRDLTEELTATEALTEGPVLRSVPFAFVTFSRTLVPVPGASGVDPGAPIVQFTVPVVASAVVRVAVTAGRLRATSGEVPARTRRSASSRRARAGSSGLNVAAPRRS